MTLPIGLQETIDEFRAGCTDKKKGVAKDVEPEIIKRFGPTYKENECIWPFVKDQVLSMAGLAGRLAALYAEIEGKSDAAWAHARQGLRDAQQECQNVFRDPRGKHCRGVDLETP